MENGTDKKSFSDFGVPAEVVEVLSSHGIEEPTKFQERALPLFGRDTDLVIQAASGSGMTLAGALGIVMALGESRPGAPRVAVLGPSRESVVHFWEMMEMVAGPLNLKGALLYGGSSFAGQEKALAEGVDYVIGTPGRVLDHLRHESLDTSGLSVVVLADGDDLLTTQVEEDLRAVMRRLPEGVRKWILTQTMPSQLKAFQREFLAQDAVQLIMNRALANLGDVDHSYYIVEGGPQRVRHLAQVIAYEEPPAAVIYANSKDSILAVAAFLEKEGHKVAPYLESMDEEEKERVAAACAEGSLRFVVTSEYDIKGVDLSKFPFLINYEFPSAPDNYLLRVNPPECNAEFHVSISLVSGQELASFRYFLLAYDVEAEEKPLPSDRQIRLRREARRFDYLQSAWLEPGPEEFRSLARRIVSHHRGYDILAHVLADFFSDVDDEELRTPENLRREGLIVGLVARDGSEYARDQLKEPKERRRGEARPRRKKAKPRQQGKKLYINLGKRHGFNHAAMLRLLEEADLHPSVLMRSDVRDHHSFIFVKKDVAQDLIQKVRQLQFKGKRIIVDYAKH